MLISTQQNLCGFLSAVFIKRYMNPSTDIIEVLGGLDTIDKIVSELVTALELIIRQSPNLDFRSKAVTTALVTVAGAFQTSLVSYFMYRDLFPALMRYVHDSPANAYQSFLLLGCLASYNKFEQHNVYQTRLEDFVDESTIRLLVTSLGETSQTICDAYTTIQDDSSTNTITLSTALTFVGLRSLSPDARKPPPPSEEEARQLFSTLPPALASTLLPTYTFVHANKIFASALLTTPSPTSTDPSPLSSFLSTTSYLTHHAHRSTRTLTAATLSLLTIRLLLEDPLTARPLCHPTTHLLSVRLARQRPPFLPTVTSPRPAACTILDITIDTLSHNLRRRLDVGLYSSSLAIILRVLATLASTTTRLKYHFPLLWGALLSLVKFLTTYAADLKNLRGLKTEVCETLANILAFGLTRGEAFLLGEKEGEDLGYKLVEGYESLVGFREAYAEKATKGKKGGGGGFERAVDVLVKVAGRYREMVSERGRGRWSVGEVGRVIREGGDDVVVEGEGGAGIDGGGDGRAGGGGEGFGRWEAWREAERKAEVKKLIRGMVEDVRVLCMQ